MKLNSEEVIIMNDWKKVEVGNTWNFKEEGKGAEFSGIYLSKEEHVGSNDSNMYHFQVGNEVIGVWGNTLLDTRFKNLNFGEEVKIVYLGTEQSEKRKGSVYHNFEVYHRVLPMSKVEDVNPDDVPF